MTELLNEIETVLAELLQSGLSTRASVAAVQCGQLAVKCEKWGLHTGKMLLEEMEQELSSRSHAIIKDDLPVTIKICRMVRYIELCREKLQENSIIQRWQEKTQD